MTEPGAFVFLLCVTAVAVAVAAFELRRDRRRRAESDQLRAEVRRLKLQLSSVLLAPPRIDQPNDAGGNVLPFPLERRR
jgi:hypothetical protein